MLLTLPFFSLMRYLLLILLLAGGYYGWDYYQNGLAPRHEALKAMEQEPCPEPISGKTQPWRWKP